MGYAYNTTIYVVIPRPLSHSQVMISLSQDLVTIISWCLKWHMRLNPKKQNPWLAGLGPLLFVYSDITLGGAELEELETLRILGVTLDSKLTFESQLRKVESKATRNLGVMR